MVQEKVIEIWPHPSEFNCLDEPMAPDASTGGSVAGWIVEAGAVMDDCHGVMANLRVRAEKSWALRFAEK